MQTTQGWGTLSHAIPVQQKRGPPALWEQLRSDSHHLLDTTPAPRHNLDIMTRAAITCLCLLLCLSATFAQTAPQVPVSIPSGTGGPDRLQIDMALQRYLAANIHRSLPEMVEVWPDLQGRKKDYDKIQRHFADSTVSDEQITLEPLEIQLTDAGALVRVQCTEQFVKTDLINPPDHNLLIMTGQPMNDPTQKQIEKKKQVKKTKTLLFELHRSTDKWTIISISEIPPK